MKVLNCRLCNVGKLSKPVLDFGWTPLANEFLPTEEKQDMFPLQVCVCESCGHYQLSESVDPERLFRHYTFVAGTSPVNVKHFETYAEHVLEKFPHLKNGKVLDIASNDGVILRHFKKLGMEILGIDPARNVAQMANDNGIPTIPEFFTNAYADQMLTEYGQFDLITANNVFAHLQDQGLNDFTKGVKKILAPQGVFVFEVSYFADVCDHNLFDTIYHEHSSYHTVKPLVSFFKTYGLELIDVERISNHGGSIRVFVCHKGLNKVNSEQINSLLQQEEDIVNKVEILRDKILTLGDKLENKLLQLYYQKKSIAIYGVPAKATTLMYALDFDRGLIDFAVDDAPLKIGTFMPSGDDVHIPVFHPDEIYQRKPDYLLILAWNFADSIMKKHKKFLDEGGSFIIPIPELKVISPTETK